MNARRVMSWWWSSLLRACRKPWANEDEPLGSLIAQGLGRRSEVSTLRPCLPFTAAVTLDPRLSRSGRGAWVLPSRSSTLHHDSGEGSPMLGGGPPPLQGLPCHPWLRRLGIASGWEALVQ